MTRAGREPAEDVKRAFRRALTLAGLVPTEIRMYKMPAVDARMVHAAASPKGWPHELPALGILAQIEFDGTVGPMTVFCCASDDDPLTEVFNAPHLQDCCCSLAELPTTLKEVWIARREVIARLNEGEAPPIFDGKWSWKRVSPPAFE